MPLSFDDQCFHRGDFNTSQDLPEGVPLEIVRSWQRCWPRFHLAQAAFLNGSSEPVYGQDDLQLSEIANPALVDICGYIDHKDFAVILVNKSGFILSLHGDEEFIQELSELGWR
jgi:transcriptional regulator of acetoin/glycerol metabolism